MLTEIKKDIATRTKDGRGFLSAAVIIWGIISVVFALDIPLETKNIGMLISTGLLTPMAFVMCKVTKSEFAVKSNELNQLGLVMNLAQLMYIPIVLYSLRTPDKVILFYSIITAAHLFPYGWLYMKKAYYVYSVCIPWVLIIISMTLGNSVIPMFMMGSLIILVLTLSFKKS